MSNSQKGGQFWSFSCLPLPSFTSFVFFSFLKGQHLYKLHFPGSLPSLFVVSFCPREVLVEKLECVKKAEPFFFMLLMMSLVIRSVTVDRNGLHYPWKFPQSVVGSFQSRNAPLTAMALPSSDVQSGFLAFRTSSPPLLLFILSSLSEL